MKLLNNSHAAMKLLTFILLFLFIPFLSNILIAQATANPTFDNLKVKAQKENKNILLYFSGSDWCAPCMKFKKTFILSETFKIYADQHLLIFNADFPRNSKNQLSQELTEQNEALADKYNPKGYFPMILLLNSNGVVLKKWEFYPSLTVDEFINALK